MDEHAEGPATVVIRDRLDADLAAGRTVVLTDAELASPEVRERLPAMLDELARRHGEQQLTGLRLPGYTVLGEIGHGGMSTVYLARHEKLQRHVAVKVAPKWLGGGQRAVERLLQEARAMARLSHANIVAVHDVLEVGDTFAIAMEWVDGMTLAALLRELPNRPDADDGERITKLLGAAATTPALAGSSMRIFVRMLRDVALAVDHVHKEQLLHLDVKPSNVLIRRDGTPLLADFGVVREIGPEFSQTRTFAGTPVYAAPEQLRREDDSIGPRTDVYGLGMTLYEALARRHPLRALEPSRLLLTVESGRVPSVAAEVDLPADLANIVHKAIAPETEHRYASAAEFADDLQAFLDHRPVRARPLGRVQRLRRWMRNEPWKAALALVLVLTMPLLLGSGGYLLVQWPNLARIEAEQGVAAATTLRVDAFRWLLHGSMTGPEAIGVLEQAVQRDPSDASLLALVAMALYFDRPHAFAVLQQRPDAVARVTGLRLVHERTDRSRTFFTADELEQLSKSGSSGDLQLLALERFMRAYDVDGTIGNREAQLRIEEAILRCGQDKLLLGLLAVVAGRSRDRDRLQAVRRIIARTWPDDMALRTWSLIAGERLDPDEVRAATTQLVEVAPRDPAAWEAFVACHARTAPEAERNLAFERWRASGVTSRHLEILAVRHRLAVGGAEAARELLQNPQIAGASPDSGHFWAAVEARRLVDPPAAAALVEELTRTHPSTFLLRGAEFVAERKQRLALAEQAWQNAQRLHPDQRFPHVQMILELGLAGHLERIPDLLRRVADTPYGVEQLLLRTLVQVGNWEQALEMAARAYPGVDAALRAEFAGFAGLAASRLGKAREAAMWFGIALHAEQRSAWFVSTLIEDAWLRCAPDSPPELRSPAIAAERVRQYERLNRMLRKPFRGRWIQLVQAEAAFANGDREAALERLDRARKNRFQDLHEPADLERLLADAERRYGR